MTTVIDTAGGFPSPEAIKAAGHSGLMAYVSLSRPGSNFAGKPITRAIADRYRAAGVDIGAIFQYGKPQGTAPSDWTTGFEGGKRMAAQALRIARDAGMPGWCPIYFAVDENITLQQWNDTAVHFFRGAGEAIGVEWVGIYGHSRVCHWAIEDKVVGRSPKPGSGPWAWVTRAWSDDTGTGYASLYQRVIDTPSNPGPLVDGIRVDVNDVYAADWGQWSVDRTPNAGQPAPAPTAPGGPADMARIGYGVTHTIPAGSDGPRRADDYVGVHTQEGGKGDAIGLANYCKTAGVSYNDAVDDVYTVRMMPPGNAPWAAVQANAVGYHVVLAGSFVSWSRDRWLSKDASDGLDEDAMLTRAARCVAAACQEFGIPVEWVGNNGATGWPQKRGICGHKDFGARGGGHTDPYPNFPIDEFMRRVRAFFAPPSPNLIDAEAKVAARWIGKRITGAATPTTTDDETPLFLDGKKIGAFARFESGHVYWRLGAALAYAIPAGGLFEAYAARDWERGLGFPVLRHTVVTTPASKVTAGVQSFEGGVLFTPVGGPVEGFVVHGEIGKRYAAMDWEQGPLGLPTSDERPVPNTDLIEQRFEFGKLTYVPTGVLVELVTN
ncbi:lysin A [Gordonia phage BobBob]|uniref:Lysin A n=1 Tax=Gordonia phage Tangent TaxID=2483675 RepID=A0A3G3MAW0_9CAUD|nr:endolysin [Gordonia phage Tangent]AYR03592.1 lysin A [Gordonia phage Tangent]QDH92682.1 lysin A [Gordonia phage Charming]UVF60727.1 lysin A [Gordonia phage BobBob]